MNEPSSIQGSESQVDTDIPLASFVGLLFRSRKLISALAIVGGGAATTMSLLSERVYESRASFIPQGSEAPTSGLSLAAGQFGLRMAGTTGLWSPAVYVQVLRSSALLEVIALDSLAMPDEGGPRQTVMEIIGVPNMPQAKRLEEAVRRLRTIVTVAEVKALNAVNLTVTTKWPRVSLHIANKLVSNVNQFNLEARKSTATVERQFVEAQALEAERALQAAEDKLQAFLLVNRAIASSPTLMFERDRLLRDVGLRQNIYSGLLSSREEAKIREFRDTPVLTVIEAPRLPASGKARRSARKGVMGGLVGAMVGIVLAIAAQGYTRLRDSSNPDAQRLVRYLEDATAPLKSRWTR